MLSKIRHFVPTSTALILYKTMVLPYLKFGSIFLFNCSEGDLDKIQKTQNKGLRFILRKDRMYSMEQLHKLKSMH